MGDREKLADDLERAFPSPHLLDDSGLLHAADALIAAGWRLIPTAGPEFEAMVERFQRAVILEGFHGDGVSHDPYIENLPEALRAALTGDRNNG